MQIILTPHKIPFGCAAALLLAVSTVTELCAAVPAVSNVRAFQLPGTKLVEIDYDVTADTDTVAINVTVSSDGGATYDVPAATFTGHYGAGVATGTGKRIVWNAGADWPFQYTSQCRTRVIANSAVPNNMALIPAGAFLMGDNYVEGGDSERPTHTVNVSGFYMDKFEVTLALWNQVRDWGQVQSYQFDYPGSGRGATHPVQSINWYDMLKWCNARSQIEGLTPAYYTDAGLTTLYKSGQITPFVRWTANGYRLPTEAEWEKAARGGRAGHHFPWPSLGGAYSSFVDGSKANYYSSGDPFETGTSPVGYYNGSQTPAGVDMANGYGLYDMSGNVWEWCWDWYDGSWYGDAGATQSDTRGPASGSNRVLRGGAWYYGGAYDLRCAQRNFDPPSYALSNIGFRCARGL